MSKKLKIILGIVSGVILIIGLFFLSSLSENKNFKRISYDDYISYTSSSSNENYVVFFGDKESESAKNLKNYCKCLACVLKSFVYKHYYPALHIIYVCKKRCL